MVLDYVVPIFGKPLTFAYQGTVYSRMVLRGGRWERCFFLDPTEAAEVARGRGMIREDTIRLTSPDGVVRGVRSAG